MPPGEDNSAVVRRLFEAVNSCDDARLDELVAPDCEIIGPAGAGRGLLFTDRSLGCCARHFRMYTS